MTVISVERARHEGLTPASLRAVARWNVKHSESRHGKHRQFDLMAQAQGLVDVAKRLEVGNDNTEQLGLTSAGARV
jgi:hypothetical protein